MRKVLATATAGVLVTGIALIAPTAGTSAGAAEAAAAATRPNIIFVLTDDQRIDTYETMPTVRNRLRGHGGNYRAIIPTSSRYALMLS